MSLLEVLVVIVGVAVLLFLLIVICNFIFNIPSLIRARRLAQVAKDLGLTFVRGNKGIFAITSRSRGPVKKNILSGNLKGHTIEAYDFNTPININIGGLYPLETSKHQWILVLDGKEQQDYLVKNIGLRVSVNEIRHILGQIS